MDSREVQPPPLQVFPPSQRMLVEPTSSYQASTAMINPNQTPTIAQPSSAVARFTFSSITQPQSQPQNSQPMDSMNSSRGFDGSPQLHYNVEPPAKKKRGRPRKYAADGNIVLQLAPTTPTASASDNNGGSVGLGSNGGEATPPTEPSANAKRIRGRPPGSGKKQLDALGGAGGVAFTPHVITVKAGEDIASKIMAFSEQGPRTVCILSANGAICNVTLHQPATSGGTVTYEGRFEIISLSGSFLLSENNGNCSRTGGLNVSLAGSDGRVLGGGVAGMLRAASPVQVIVGSFIADGKKQNSCVFKSGPSSLLTPQTVNFTAEGASANHPSQGPSSESSDENGGSPLHRGSGFYSNAAPSLHNNSSQMYQLWSN